ncbi:uncharacterized protein METZ01_LOCUS178917, partial [marine metagenome]
MRLALALCNSPPFIVAICHLDFFNYHRSMQSDFFIVAIFITTPADGSMLPRILKAHKWRPDMFRNVLCLFALVILVTPTDIQSQEARNRWERMAQIRREKFDLVLPQVMKENEIDMWIVMMKEGHLDPLYEDLGRGYVGSVGYYIFTDTGANRIERVA